MRSLLMFDFDGVVADSLDVFHECLAEACAVVGIATLRDRAAFLDLFDGNMVEGLVRAGVAEDVVPDVLQDLGGRLSAAMDRYPPFPGVRAAICGLAASGPVYIITSNVSSVVRAYLVRQGIEGIRDVLGSDREASKRTKIERLSAEWPWLRPVYVGDTRGDMLEAHAAGAQAVAVTWGWHDEARLRRGSPDRVLSCPGELPGLADA